MADKAELTLKLVDEAVPANKPVAPAPSSSSPVGAVPVQSGARGGEAAPGDAEHFAKGEAAPNINVDLKPNIEVNVGEVKVDKDAVVEAKGGEFISGDKDHIKADVPEAKAQKLTLEQPPKEYEFEKPPAQPAPVVVPAPEVKVNVQPAEAAVPEVRTNVVVNPAEEKASGVPAGAAAPVVAAGGNAPVAARGDAGISAPTMPVGGAPEWKHQPTPLAKQEGVVGSDLSSVGAGAGSAIVANMYEAMFAKHEAGTTTEGGQPSVYLQVAAAVRSAGRDLSKEDFTALVKDVSDVESTGQERQQELRGIVSKWTEKVPESPLGVAAAPTTALPAGAVAATPPVADQQQQVAEHRRAAEAYPDLPVPMALAKLREAAPPATAPVPLPEPPTEQSRRATEAAMKGNVSRRLSREEWEAIPPELRDAFAKKMGVGPPLEEAAPPEPAAAAPEDIQIVKPATKPPPEPVQFGDRAAEATQRKVDEIRASRGEVVAPLPASPVTGGGGVPNKPPADSLDDEEPPPLTPWEQKAADSAAILDMVSAKKTGVYTDRHGRKHRFVGGQRVGEAEFAKQGGGGGGDPPDPPDPPDDDPYVADAVPEAKPLHDDEAYRRQARAAKADRERAKRYKEVRREVDPEFDKDEREAEQKKDAGEVSQMLQLGGIAMGGRAGRWMNVAGMAVRAFPQLATQVSGAVQGAMGLGGTEAAATAAVAAPVAAAAAAPAAAAVAAPVAAAAAEAAIPTAVAATTAATGQAIPMAVLAPPAVAPAAAAGAEAGGAELAVAGSGAAGAGLAAALGSVGFVVAAVTAVKEEVRQVGEAGRSAVGGVNAASGAVLSLDSDRMANNLASGFDAVADKAADVVPALGMLTPAAKEFVHGIIGMRDEVRRTSELLGQYHGGLASTLANEEARQTLRDVDRAGRFGDDFNRLMESRIRMDQSLEQLTDRLMPLFVRYAESSLDALTAIIDGVNNGTQIVAGALAGILDAVSAIDPTGTVGREVAGIREILRQILEGGDPANVEDPLQDMQRVIAAVNQMAGAMPGAAPVAGMPQMVAPGFPQFLVP
jgi:hypothetical protein